MAYERISDHVDQAERLLIDQYKGKPRLLALLRSYIRRCQETEDAIYNSILQRMIDNAVGVSLDAIGKAVGEARQGREDELYRVFLRARIRINLSHGRAPDIIAVLLLVDTARFRFRDVLTALTQQATFRIDYHEPPSSSAIGSALAQLVSEARAGGVAAIVYQPTSASRGGFFGSVYAPTLNEVVGFSSFYDDTVGGFFGHAARA